MDYIWAAMMLLSFIFGMMNGRMDEVTGAVFSGSASAIDVCISLLGTMCFWSGIMKIAESSGVSRAIGRVLSPLIKLIFPGLDTKGAAANAICMNVSANMLGLGNAATPFGLEAMKQLSDLNPSPLKASNYMITFVVLNTSSVQIIPTTIAMLRSKYGAANPMDIMPAVWITSILSLVIGLAVAMVLNKRRVQS